MSQSSERPMACSMHMHTWHAQKNELVMCIINVATNDQES
jgi:hypothetical protein